MAKQLVSLEVFLNSGGGDLTILPLYAQYYIADGDLGKFDRVEVEGIDLGATTVSGLWNTVIDTIKTKEGIE